VLAPLLRLEPEQIVIANRTADRAAALAAAFADLGATHGASFTEVGTEPFDLIINATSASLSGQIPPIPASAVGPQTVCYDLAYGRTAVAFVEWARASGCARALQGLGMLVEQAAESFRLWRGIRPDTSLVLAALKDRTGST
jgi:shikimate dehydrogenase